MGSLYFGKHNTPSFFISSPKTKSFMFINFRVGSNINLARLRNYVFYSLSLSSLPLRKAERNCITDSVLLSELFSAPHPSDPGSIY